MNFHSKEISKLYQEIAEKRKKIITLRKEEPLEEIKDYSFKNKKGEVVNLYSLFGDSDELLVIHNMGKRCPYCTMWADGFRGYTEMMNDKMPWVLTSPDDFKTLKEFSESRNWNFNVMSFHGTNFAKDLQFFFDKDGKTHYWPGVSALIKKNGKVYRTAKESFGPGDLFNPVWHFWDMFPKGADGWQPKYKY